MSKLDEIIAELDKHQENIETLERALYGDSRNQVEGVIQTLKDLKAIVKKIQDERKKILYFSMGALAIVELVYKVGPLVWSYIKPR